MKNKFIKLMALILAIIMLAGTLPTYAIQAEDNDFSFCDGLSEASSQATPDYDRYTAASNENVPNIATGFTGIASLSATGFTDIVPLSATNSTSIRITTINALYNSTR